MIPLRSKVPAALAAFVCAALIGLAAHAGAASAAELIVFRTAHCPHCVAFEREIGRTYGQSAEARQAPLRRVDMDARRPADLTRIRGVEGTPTFVLMHEGHEVGRIEGYPGSRLFYPELRKLLARIDPKT